MLHSIWSDEMRWELKLFPAVLNNIRWCKFKLSKKQSQAGRAFPSLCINVYPMQGLRRTSLYVSSLFGESGQAGKIAPATSLIKHMLWLKFLQCHQTPVHPSTRTPLPPLNLFDQRILGDLWDRQNFPLLTHSPSADWGSAAHTWAQTNSQCSLLMWLRCSQTR